MNVKAKNKGQAVFFKSPYLEVFTKSHPLLIWGMFLPTSVYLLWFGYTQHGLTAPFSSAVFVVGVFAWTLFEYLMHRYLFHLVSDNPRVQKFLYQAHGVHHEYPRDRHHLFMPPLVSVVIALTLYYVFGLLMGSGVYAFLPGFIVGYLLYGTVHYCIHAFNPPFRFMKPLWRYHHIHHYADHDKGFGVSSPFWDHVFGTVPADRKEAGKNF